VAGDAAVCGRAAGDGRLMLLINGAHAYNQDDRWIMRSTISSDLLKKKIRQREKSNLPS
jgi:hypothetical protein